jgi:hypothetical protein
MRGRVVAARRLFDIKEKVVLRQAGKSPTRLIGKSARCRHSRHAGSRAGGGWTGMYWGPCVLRATVSRTLPIGTQSGSMDALYAK